MKEAREGGRCVEQEAAILSTLLVGESPSERTRQTRQEQAGVEKRKEHLLNLKNRTGKGKNRRGGEVARRTGMPHSICCTQ